MTKYKIQKFPASRIATIDIGEMGKRKHHVTGLIEMDVSESRKKIKEYNTKSSTRISFTAWLICVIATTLKKHETSHAFLKGKNKRVIFENINVSLIVEKSLNGTKVPVPLIIERADKLSIEAITIQIAKARDEEFTAHDIVLQKKARKTEKFYYLLPGPVRRQVWKYILKHPKLAFNKMGNVAFTSIGMMGKVNGWFIPSSVHPICFGVGSIIKKPAVVDDRIEIREMLNITVLMDHDVIDGAPMARFISELSKNIEMGLKLGKPNPYSE